MHFRRSGLRNVRAPAATRVQTDGAEITGDTVH